MDTQNRPMTMKTVTDTFAAWKTVHDRTAALDEAYKLALEQHAADAAPFPTELKAQIAALWEESDRLLVAAQHALLKIKTPKSSAESGDSTLV